MEERKIIEKADGRNPKADGRNMHNSYITLASVSQFYFGHHFCWEGQAGFCQSDSSIGNSRWGK